MTHDLTHPQDDVQDGAAPGPPRASGAARAVRWVLGILLVVLLAAGVALFAGGRAAPGEDSAPVGFARDMIDHHAQAVNMATIVQRRTQDDAVRYLATDIALTQTNQMGQMQAWLNVWGRAVGRTGPPMQWMTDGHGAMQMGGTTVSSTAQMPGMATQAQVNRLGSLPVKQADVLFLQLMIAHHRGGVEMAQAALDRTDEPVVVTLARSMVRAQESEITLMQQMLTERGAQPTPAAS